MAPVTLTIRAVDRGWVMGPDIQLEIDTLTPLREVFVLLKARKRVPKSRVVLKVAPFLDAPTRKDPDPPVSLVSYRWDKGEVGGKGDWGVRRCGIYDGVMVTVEPSFPAAWAWEPLQWHEVRWFSAQ
jgi:hypothetical protein